MMNLNVDNKDLQKILTVVLVLAGAFSIVHYYHHIKLAKLTIEQKEKELSK